MRQGKINGALEQSYFAQSMHFFLLNEPFCSLLRCFLRY